MSRYQVGRVRYVVYKVLTLGDEAWAGFHDEPGPAEALLPRLLDELELNGNLTRVSNGQRSIRRFDKSNCVEHNVCGVHHNLNNC